MKTPSALVAASGWQHSERERAEFGTRRSQREHVRTEEPFSSLHDSESSDRLIGLFASENGFVGTTSADIERAAGLKPGAGGLFSHFKTKEDVLRAAIADLANRNESVRAPFESIRLGDLRAELTLLARGVLLALDANRNLVLIWLKENDRFPELQSFMEEAVNRPSAVWIGRWLQERVSAGELAPHDSEAVGTVALGAITAWWIWRESSGTTPPLVDADRFVDGWVELLMRLAPVAAGRSHDAMDDAL